MPDFAVNIPGEPREDLSGFAVNAPAQGGSQPPSNLTANISGLPDDLFNKYSQGPTAQLMPADPKKGYGTSYYAAYTNDGDMAGAVMVADGQKVRLVDKMTGDVVFEGVGPEGARLATSVANGISQDMGRKAAWAIQKPTDEGGWVSMAEERYDPKEQSTLGKLADFALPILGAILMPVTGGMSAAIAAGLGSAAGSALSSIAQGRSVEETLKRAAIAGVTAGVGAKVMPMVGNALAPKSAMTDMLVAAQNKAIEMGVSTQPFSSALAAEAAKTAAEQPIRSALSKAYDVTTGAVDDAAASVRGAVKGALSTATDVGKTALEKVASNAVAGTVSPVNVFGTAAPGAATGALAGAGAGAALPGALTGTSGQPTLRGGDNTGTKIDEVEVTGERPGTDTGAVVGGGLAVDTGTPVSEVKVVADKPPGTDTGAVVGGGLAVDTGTPVSEVKVVADKPPGTDTGAVVGDVLTGSEGNDTLEDTSTDDEVKDKTGLKVDPKLVELVLTLLGGAGGAAGDKKGPSTLPPGVMDAGQPGSTSSIFRSTLPPPSGPFADMSARNVSMTPEEWKTYGQRGQMSFLNSTPVRPSGITPVKPPGGQAPVNPGLNPAEAEPGLKVTNAPTTGSTPAAAEPGLKVTNTPVSRPNDRVSKNADGTYTVQFGPEYGRTYKTFAGAEAAYSQFEGKALSPEAKAALAADSGYHIDDEIGAIYKDPTKAVKASNGKYYISDKGSPFGYDSFATEAEALASIKYKNDRMNTVQTLPPGHPSAGKFFVYNEYGGGKTYNTSQEAQAAIDSRKNAAPAQPVSGFNSTAPSSVSSTTGGNSALAVNTQPLGTQGAAPAQPVPGFNPGATVPDELRDDGFNQPRANPSPFAVAVDGLQDRRAQPLPTPTANPEDFARGGFAVRGPGTGRSDDIPARLSDGEYVIDAETVALLGDGSTKSGASKLDQFRVNIRKHKGRKLAKGAFSVDAKPPEAYLRGGRAR
jgi:hypothetical protein